MQHIKYLLIILISFFFISCSQKDISFEKTSFSKIDGFFDDDLNLAFEVFKKDCEKSQINPKFTNVCKLSETYNDAKKFFTENFEAFTIVDRNKSKQGLITGYYEPLLKGSFEKTLKYKYPVYALPEDLVISDDSKLKDYRNIGRVENNRLTPYYKREEIDAQISKSLKAILYVDNKIDLFFLQIQGSGRVELEDKTLINLAWAGQNGRAYRSIGKYLVENNIFTLEEIDGIKIKEYLNENQEKVDEILNTNESYIFFKISPNIATGALNTVLTPKRNIAVDRRYIELGTPVFIKTTNPITKEPINKLVVAADVGGAIKGEIRADFYWGFGEEAKLNSHKMKEYGEIIVLEPKK
ncbi:murein transglycosylase A [Arcobacter porcinus]|uniref:peptidoglycan lytic exotransglycosylase n=1 Tax=Arcobacter porcinus TaxID=1935204 RepID=A0A5C2HF30_9BACT|nr:murein transglycosylase A [Arcobacter porcinus]OCL88173.1 Membrane-bound lytic murein transglycosylase A precursor [Arcobacter porcinus]OCL94509.1 Membrane-bound lytic murein transglycosylase A precursor [Aliarcobacter thereius]QEP41499.1 membrane-bound lytic murein transglycosylase A [Arcobacter porcinus]